MRRRMDQTEPGRMQRTSREAAGVVRPAAIKLVANEGVADVGSMHTDLVCAARAGVRRVRERERERERERVSSYIYLNIYIYIYVCVCAE
jgi:uncharacterized phage protein gp47/JayE